MLKNIECFLWVWGILQSVVSHHIMKIFLILVLIIWDFMLLFHFCNFVIQYSLQTIHPPDLSGRWYNTSGDPETQSWRESLMWCVFQVSLTFWRSSFKTAWKQNQRHSFWSSLSRSSIPELDMSLKKLIHQLDRIFRKCDHQFSILWFFVDVPYLCDFSPANASVPSERK